MQRVCSYIELLVCCQIFDRSHKSNARSLSCRKCLKNAMYMCLEVKKMIVKINFVATPAVENDADIG